MSKVTYSAGGPVGEVRRLDKLRPNPLNPRTIREDDPETVELADSIRSRGLLQPLLITPDGLIVAGHRRALAAKRAGLTHVPVIVRELDETTQLEAMLIENLQRKALNPVETARACGALRQRGLTVDAIAVRVGIGKGTVAKYLQVVEMPAEIQRQLAEYDISLSYIPHLARLQSDADRLVICRQAAAESWLTSEVERAVNQALGRSAGRAPRSTATPVARQPVAAPVAPVTKNPRGRLIEILNEGAILIRRNPALVNDPVVRDCFDSVAMAVRAAQKAA